MLDYDNSRTYFHNWGNPKFKSANNEGLFESRLPASEMNKNLIKSKRPDQVHEPIPKKGPLASNVEGMQGLGTFSPWPESFADSFYGNNGPEIQAAKLVGQPDYKNINKNLIQSNLKYKGEPVPLQRTFAGVLEMLDEGGKILNAKGEKISSIPEVKAQVQKDLTLLDYIELAKSLSTSPNLTEPERNSWKSISDVLLQFEKLKSIKKLSLEDEALILTYKELIDKTVQSNIKVPVIPFLAPQDIIELEEEEVKKVPFPQPDIREMGRHQREYEEDKLVIEALEPELKQEAEAEAEDKSKVGKGGLVKYIEDYLKDNNVNLLKNEYVVSKDNFPNIEEFMIKYGIPAPINYADVPKIQKEEALRFYNNQLINVQDKFNNMVDTILTTKIPDVDLNAYVRDINKPDVDSLYKDMKRNLLTAKISQYEIKDRQDEIHALNKQMYDPINPPTPRTKQHLTNEINRLQKEIKPIVSHNLAYEVLDSKTPGAQEDIDTALITNIQQNVLDYQIRNLHKRETEIEDNSHQAFKDFEAKEKILNNEYNKFYYVKKDLKNKNKENEITLKELQDQLSEEKNLSKITNIERRIDHINDEIDDNSKLIIDATKQMMTIDRNLNDIEDEYNLILFQNKELSDELHQSINNQRLQLQASEEKVANFIKEKNKKLKEEIREENRR